MDVGEVTSRREPTGWKRALRGYVLLPHIVPVLVVSVATVAFAIVAWGGLPPWRLLLPLLLAMLGGQLAIGALNELVDAPLDALVKPWKPLPSGAVSAGGAKAMVVIGLVMMTVFGAPFGATPFAILTLGTGLGLAYDLWLKRSSWSWLPYVLALPLLPIWVFTALGRPEARLLFLYPLGALATAGVHFAQALPDTARDRTAGLRTVTARLGLWRTFALAWSAALSSPALATVFAMRALEREASEVLGVIAFGAVGLMLVNVVLIVKTPRWGVAVCFPFVAAVAVVSGLVWVMNVAR